MYRGIKASYAMPVVSAPLSFYKIRYCVHIVCMIVLIRKKAFIFIQQGEKKAEMLLNTYSLYIQIISRLPLGMYIV